MISEPNTFPIAEPDLSTLAVERSKEYEAFLKYVAEKTGHISYAQMAIIWPAICQSALEWILRDKKSVDMGFIILHPSPLRSNWKNILIALFPMLGPALLGKSKAIKQAILESTGFFHKFYSAEMLAVAGERLAAWGIEIELKKSWWRAMFKLEGHKFAVLGSVDYAAYIARAIQRLRPKLVRCYLGFLRQVSYPCGAVRISRSYRRPFLVPYVPRGRVRAVALADVPTSIVEPRDPERIAAPKLKDTVSTDAGLPEVPNLPEGPQDLRICSSPEQ